MKISDYIKKSLDESDKRDLEPAFLHVCAAVDGTSKKEYPQIKRVGERFKKFIVDNIDVIELMFGGINLKDTTFPFQKKNGSIGVKFEDIIYENFRCHLAHGDELDEGFGINLKIESGLDTFKVDILNQAMTIPESCIYALGLPCVLATSNSDQFIGNENYKYYCFEYSYEIDKWWGQANGAKKSLPFHKAIRVKLDFKNVWPEESQVV